MRTALLLGLPTLVASQLACGARSELVSDPAGGPPASPVRACLPACMARYLASCVAPLGECSGYVAARPNAWRHCFANGASITAVDNGPGVGTETWTIEDRRACVTIQHRGAATVDVYAWTDRDGAELATVSTLTSRGRRWVVTCDGTEHMVDLDSAGCAGDPWLAAIRPYSYSCPSSAQCRPR